MNEVSEEDEVIYPVLTWSNVVGFENCGDCVGEMSEDETRAAGAKWCIVVDEVKVTPLDDEVDLLVAAYGAASEGRVHI